jgi:hypothetical protein
MATWFFYGFAAYEIYQLFANLFAVVH